MLRTDKPSVRELAHRAGGGLTVQLLWDSDTDRLTVSVTDESRGGCFQVPASPDVALRVFYHPYAYVPRGAFEAEVRSPRLHEAA